MNLQCLKDLNLSPEEPRDIIEFIVKKRNVNNYKHKSNDELLSAIKEKTKILTPKKPLKLTKQKNNQVLTPEKLLKNPKRKNNQILTPKNNQSQKTMFNNKERTGIIREELKELAYKVN